MTRASRPVLPAVLAACLLAVAPFAAAAERQPYIYGGTDAAPGSYPFMVALVESSSLTNYDGQFCGAALVAPSWVLTAAHCVDWIGSPAEIEAVVGAYQLGGTSAGRVAISEVHIHPDYDDATLTNDVALLALATPSVATPVTLAEAIEVTAIPLGADVVAIGFGLTDFVPDPVTNTLQEVEVDFIPRNTCDSAGYYGFGGAISPDQFCAGPFVTEPVLGGAFPEISGGFGICNGDSGGPLLYNGTQIGISSFGPESACAEVDIPDGYANVGYQRAWIDSMLDGVDIEVAGTLAPVSPTEYDVTFTVTNLSSVNTATAVELVYSTPVGTPVFTDVAAEPDCSGAVPTCAVGDLAPGASVSYTLRIETPIGDAWRVRAAVDYAGDTDDRNDVDQVGMGSIAPEPPFGGSGSGGGGAGHALLLLLGALALRRRG